jgi:hypothetical protein
LNAIGICSLAAAGGSQKVPGIVFFSAAAVSARIDHPHILEVEAERVFGHFLQKNSKK